MQTSSYQDKPELAAVADAVARIAMAAVARNRPWVTLPRAVADISYISRQQRRRAAMVAEYEREAKAGRPPSYGRRGRRSTARFFAVMKLRGHWPAAA